MDTELSKEVELTSSSTQPIGDPETNILASAAPPGLPPRPIKLKVKGKAKRKLAANNPNPCKPKKQPPANGARRSAIAWDHFTIVSGSDKTIRMAACNYYGKRYYCDPKIHGTSNLNAHLKVCPKFLYSLVFDPSQSIITFQPKKEGGSNMIPAPQVCDVEACRKALAVFVIVDEQPFRVVEGWGLKYLCSKLQPQFHLPSRWTVGRDCYQLYLDEKLKLKDFLRSNCARVCLTTDCWTSVQNLNYMALTAHFVDNDWNLQKRILNFFLIPNHKGETIGKQIEMCLHEWGIEGVFTVTMDNASSNDVAIAYLKKRIKTTNNLVLDGENLHVRCCAYFVNLIVNEGLKELHLSIAAIHNAVRYVRSSPARLTKFKQCIEQCKIPSKSLVCLDVPTRWNSTYLMLEAAQKFQVAFEMLEDDDPTYVDYFDAKSVGPPISNDWSNARIFCKFLKNFYDCTLVLSGSLYATSNEAFPQLALIQSELLSMDKSCDFILRSMAADMKGKFDKYWGTVDKFNPLLYVANVLDPRYKVAYLKWSFDDIYDPVTVADKLFKLKKELQKYYEWYCAIYEPKAVGNEEGQTSKQQGNSGCQEEKHAHKARNDAFKSHLKEKDSIEAKNEMERYLAEPCIDADETFNLLEWWKSNSSRFHVLSFIARDVLAIPVSTVAYESAFSTGGRVLDPFRSSLSPRVVEALICSQNWLRPNLVNFDLEGTELFEDCEKIVSEIEQLAARIPQENVQQPVAVD